MPVRYCCKDGQTLHNPTLVFCRQIRAKEILIPGEATDAHRGCQRPHKYIEAIAARVSHLCHNQSALKKGFDYVEDNKISCLYLSLLQLCWRRWCRRASKALAAPDWSHYCVRTETRSTWSQRAKGRQRRDAAFPSWDASCLSYFCTI